MQHRPPQAGGEVAVAATARIDYSATTMRNNSAYV